MKDFQEYLTQQTHHVNMISGSVSGDKEAEALQGDQNGLDHLSVEVSLDENSGMLVDGFERTFDGKLKCQYCNYASKGTAQLVEHIRIYTGEKPHRCPLCPFASAYERYLEVHVRSHTGEKPYIVNYVPSAAVIEVTCPITAGAGIKWSQLKVSGLP